MPRAEEFRIKDIVALNYRIKKSILLKLFSITLFGLIILITIWNTSVPKKYLASKIKEQLLANGLSDVKLSVTDFSLNSLTVKDIDLGENLPVKITQLKCFYKLNDIINKRVNRITIKGGSYFIKKSKSNKSPIKALPFNKLRIFDFQIQTEITPNTKLKATIDARIQPDGDTIKIISNIKDGTITNKEDEFSVKSLTGKIIANYKESKITVNDSSFKFSKAKMGTLLFDKGKINLSFFEDKILFKTVWLDFLGGNLLAENFHVNTEGYATQVMIRVNKLSLNKTLDWLLKDTLSGTGEVNGKVFITIPKWPILLVEPGGYLVATGSPGRLELYKSQVIGTALNSYDKKVQKTGQLLIEVMRNFYYDEFRLDIIKEDKSVIGRIFLKGEGETSTHKQPVGGLTINDHNFQRNLLALILGNDMFVKMKDKIENMTKNK